MAPGEDNKLQDSITKVKPVRPLPVEEEILKSVLGSGNSNSNEIQLELQTLFIKQDHKAVGRCSHQACFHYD